jgi:hypothetical protein
MRRLGNVALPRLAHQAGRSIQKEIAVAGRRFRILVDGDDDFARGTKSKPIPGPHQVYGFLTTAPNVVVHAGDPDNGRGARCPDASAVG